MNKPSNPTDTKQPTRPYACIYRGITIHLRATSQYQAQVQATKEFQAMPPNRRRKVKGYDIAIMLTDVIHNGAVL